MDVICFGSATMDTFVYISPKTLGQNICFYPGTKLEIKELKSFSGGGATNTSVGFSRMGLKTGIISFLGEDAEADEIIKELKKEKVITTGVFKDKKNRTARSVILTGFGRDRVILTYTKTLSLLSKKHVPWKKLDSKWFYISSLHSKPVLLKKITEFAFKKEIKIAFNPGSAEIKAGLKALLPVLKKTEILVLNSSEALELTHKANIQKNLFELNQYCKTVVITDGKNGSHAIRSGKTFYQKPFNVKVIDTTGAGDAFACAFVAAVINGKTIKHSLELATANASSVIQSLGTKNVLLSQKQAEKLVKKLS